MAILPYDPRFERGAATQPPENQFGTTPSAPTTARPTGQERYPTTTTQATAPTGGMPLLGSLAGYPTAQNLSADRSFLQNYQIDYNQLGPHTRTVGDQELVQNQLQGLLASDSPYMQQARLAGERAAASRGALSSSIFAGASQSAAIQAALPIAAADAQTYSRVASENAAAINANTMAKMQSLTQMAATSISAEANLEVANLKVRADQEARNFMAMHDQIMASMRHGQAIELANLDFGFRERLAQAGFMHDLNMRELSHEQQQQIMFLAQEYGLETIGYQGSIQSFLQDQQLRAAFLNSGMGNIFQSINLLNQEGLDGAAFNTAVQNIYRTFENFMSLFNSLSGGGGFNFQFPQFSVPTGP